MVIDILVGHKAPLRRARVDEMIRSALANRSSAARRKTVREIECLDSWQDYVPILQEIAKTNPQKLPRKTDNGGDGNEFYPVRFEARRALRHIQNNQHCGL